MSNRQAFLSMIAVSEGTKGKCNDDGYSCLVGGSCFSGYSDHPRVSVYISNLGIHSTAAGRYQIRAAIFDFYKQSLKLSDFGPESQDAIAIQLIKECNALDEVDSGRLQAAIDKCRSRWASFPNAGYGQRQNSVLSLIEAFQNNGGTLA